MVQSCGQRRRGPRAVRLRAVASYLGAWRRLLATDAVDRHCTPGKSAEAALASRSEMNSPTMARRAMPKCGQHAHANRTSRSAPDRTPAPRCPDPRRACSRQPRWSQAAAAPQAPHKQAIESEDGGEKARDLVPGRQPEQRDHLALGSCGTRNPRRPAEQWLPGPLDFVTLGHRRSHVEC